MLLLLIIQFDISRSYGVLICVILKHYWLERGIRSERTTCVQRW